MSLTKISYYDHENVFISAIVAKVGSLEKLKKVIEENKPEDTKFHVTINHDDDTMKVTIHFPGDPSVGMYSYNHEMTIERFSKYDDSKEYREEIRAKIKELYELIDSENACEVLFDDED